MTTNPEAALADELAAYLKQHIILCRDTPLGDLLGRILAALRAKPAGDLIRAECWPGCEDRYCPYTHKDTDHG